MSSPAAQAEPPAKVATPDYTWHSGCCLMVMLIQRVIVAGAGLAGLAVADALARDGRTVTIVEARDRLGGRAWTTREPFVDGAFADLGAEFIDEDHHRVRLIAKRLGVSTIRVLKRGFTERYRSGGGFTVSRTRGWEDLREALAPLVRQYQNASGDDESRRVRELATFSVRDWLRHDGAPAHVHALADAMRGFFLADPEELSALPLVAELAQGESPGQTPMYRFIGGTGELIGALWRHLRARVLVQHRLQAIHHAVDRVVCAVLDAHGRQQDLEADAVVLTLPASTLRDVVITPALPDPQWRAVQSLRYGCATKAVLQTSSDLFAGRPARAFATDTHVGAFWDAGEGQPDGTSIVSFLGGASASAALAARLHEGAERLVGDLCWLRRADPSPRVRAHAHWTWEQDPFARGGYAYVDPGFDSAWLPLLGRRAGRLFFAGEHTSERYQGYMEGALESAERVVAEVNT